MLSQIPCSWGSDLKEDKDTIRWRGGLLSVCILQALIGYKDGHLHRKGARFSIFLLKVVFFAGQIIRVPLTGYRNKILPG